MPFNSSLRSRVREAVGKIVEKTSSVSSVCHFDFCHGSIDWKEIVIGASEVSFSISHRLFHILHDRHKLKSSFD